MLLLGRCCHRCRRGFRRRPGQARHRPYWRWCWCALAAPSREPTRAPWRTPGARSRASACHLERSRALKSAACPSRATGRAGGRGQRRELSSQSRPSGYVPCSEHEFTHLTPRSLVCPRYCIFSQSNSNGKVRCKLFPAGKKSELLNQGVHLNPF